MLVENLLLSWWWLRCSCFDELLVGLVTSAVRRGIVTVRIDWWCFRGFQALVDLRVVYHF